MNLFNCATRWEFIAIGHPNAGSATMSRRRCEREKVMVGPAERNLHRNLENLTSTEFGPTLYFISQFDSSLEKYFDDFVLNGKKNLQKVWGQCIGCQNPGDGVQQPDGTWRALKPGEFLLGYEDEVGPEGTQTPEPFELRRNGTYVVFRKLYQDVAAFRRYLATAAKSIYGSDDQSHQELVAAKMMGRWRSGCPVDLSPEKDDAVIAADPHRRNNFNYEGDDEGVRCPLGSHLRRTKPRATPLKRATAVRRHRSVKNPWRVLMVRTPTDGEKQVALAGFVRRRR